MAIFCYIIGTKVNFSTYYLIILLITIYILIINLLGNSFGPFKENSSRSIPKEEHKLGAFDSTRRKTTFIKKKNSFI